MLDAPVKAKMPRASGSRAAGDAPPVPMPRRDLAEDFARRSRVADASRAGGQPGRNPGERNSGELRRQVAPRRLSGLRLRLGRGVRRTWAGRLLTGGLVLASLAAAAAVVWEARALLLHDPRLQLASSSSIEITGNRHVSRAQLLSVFGEDVDRNLLSVPMSERRAELEAMPWVEHATVMRLLPDHVRVAIVERTPVAFVRQGSHIGLVDAHGVLLDLAPDASVDDHYSFPVVTGLSSADPLSTREARMQLYARFTRDLDAGGAAISQGLSEVDLSSPEDVKALIPGDGSTVLVHFGEQDFLARYRRFEANLPGWKAQYPRLAAVDMRYERQVVLEMGKGIEIPAGAAAAEGGDDSAGVAADKPLAPGKAGGGAHAAAAGSGRSAVPERASAGRKGGSQRVAKPRRKAAKTAAAKHAANAQPEWQRRLNGVRNGVRAQHSERSFAVGGDGVHSSPQGPQ